VSESDVFGWVAAAICVRTAIEHLRAPRAADIRGALRPRETQRPSAWGWAPMVGRRAACPMTLVSRRQEVGNAELQARHHHSIEIETSRRKPLTLWSKRPHSTSPFCAAEGPLPPAPPRASSGSAR
jgi:hypothetical protein